MPEKSPRKPPKQKQKKPWEPPKVKTGHLFESNSLACGKSGPGSEECLQNPTMS